MYYYLWVFYVQSPLYYTGLSYVLLLMGLFYVQSPLYYMGLSYVLRSLLCTKSPILYGSFVCTTVSFYVRSPLYYMGLSYVLLLMGLFYVRSSLYYTSLFYVQSSLYYMGLFYVPSPYIHIHSFIHTIMGPSYVHQLLWGLTPLHKMVTIYTLCTLIFVGSYSCT